MKKLLTLLIACLALTVTACGDDDDDGGGDSGGATTTEQTDTGSSDTGGEEPAEGVSISIVDNDFDPAETTVPAGSVVVWTNEGQAPHTVTAEGDFDSGNIDPNGTFEQVLDTAGTIDYVCTIHPGQEGSITVE